MPTTKQEQYLRLRKLLNRNLQGKNIEAMLWSLANPAVHLVNTVEAVNDNVYIATAVDRYLDQRLADYNVERPAKVGLSDDVFRQIGISVINDKQIRQLIMSILSTIFGDELTQATAKSNSVEPYNLDDGDDLFVKFDGGAIARVAFDAGQFSNISAATAQEVADAITKSLRAQGLTGRAFSQDDGSGAYVTLISDTKGPQSSVAVFGGKAQNVLLFDKSRPTTAGPSTEWTLSLVSGGKVRFTWTSGANPSVGKIRVGDYVNVFGSGFSGANQGTFTITDFKGGSVGNAFFEIDNPFGVAEIVTQGTADAVLFFYPYKNSLTTKNRYAAIFQEESRLLEVFLPATTKVVRRERKGAAHIHEPVLESESYTAAIGEITDLTFPIPSSINDGEYFLINSGNDTTEYYVYFDTTGANLSDPSVVGKTGLRVDISTSLTANDVAVAVRDALIDTGDFSCTEPSSSSLRVCNVEAGDTADAVNVDVTGLVVSIFQQGADEVETQSSTPNPDEALPDQEGPYIYDLSQPFVLSDVASSLSSSFSAETGQVMSIVDASEFPDSQGYLVLGYGTDAQEGPVPYISRPSSNTLLLSPAYTIQNIHQSGTEVRLLSQLGTVQVDKIGGDYPAYLTDVVAGRVYAEDLIKMVAATGINIVITILYPGDEGLGRWGTENSEKVIIWGEDENV